MSLFGQRPSGFGTPANTLGQNQAPTTSSLFSQPQMQQQQQQQPQNQQQSNPFGGSLLGGNTFGQQQQQPQQQQQQPSNAFGGSLLGQTQIQQQPQQQPGGPGFMNASQGPAQRSSLIWEPGRESLTHKPVTEQIEGMLSKWSPNNPNTVFKYYFYNKVDQARVPFYQPSSAEDPREWEQAVHDKPGPGYMPAFATGFKAVSERLIMQKQVLGNYRQALHSINSSLDAILSQHDLQTSVRTLNARRKHAMLRQRCLALATKVQVLRNRGYSLDKEEDELKTKLETLDRGVTDPALSARTEELWSRLIMLRGYADSLQQEVTQRGAETQEGIGEENEAQAREILEKFDKQLQSLKTALEQVKKDYDEWTEANPSPKK
ncbi:nucleoporin complex subunit 54-domain-containing protein [Annulohypoxylon maeteangense]|uniref:nucleoporin complex subunit 54-domain-containing protein n=1 Tax=Annulohypoxylon maeteangense TaxID=1927788 RepID=UPI002007DBF8|nr:nucleoporin complex subunit 54-domain-containing protein [Annulohypoxylon maeteangense]KAI0885995.1 nucleoporin complex subunit 54-domain-containing protein [Annulohypoxylon maeteangense]